MSISKSRTILTGSVVLFLCFLFIQPGRAIEGARQGLLLWYQAVLPSQFPFVVGIQLLLQLQNFSFLPPALLCYLSGLISGYPVGALTAATLYQRGQLPERSLTQMAAFCNMAGPLFVVGTVGVGLLHSARHGYLLLAIQWVSSGICLIFSAPRKKLAVPAALPKKPIGRMLGDAVESAAELMLKVCGFIVVFSVLMQWVPGWLGGLLEMTNGVRWAAESNLAQTEKLIICSFLINFSGICVLLQSLAAAEKAPVKTGRFLAYKLGQAILAAGITLAFCQILGC